MTMAMLAIAAMGNVAFSLALGGLAALCASESYTSRMNDGPAFRR